MRLVTTLVLSAALGTLASVGGAWLAAVIPHGYRRVPLPATGWVVPPFPGGSGSPSDAHLNTSAAVEIVNLLELDANRRIVQAQFVTRSGWPFLCLESGVCMSTTPPAWIAMTGSRAGIRLPRSVTARLDLPAATTLPTHPCVPGLLADVALFGAAAFAALRGLDHLVARRRRRVGVCTNCGYTLDATAVRCPECGAARSAVR